MDFISVILEIFMDFNSVSPTIITYMLFNSTCKLKIYNYANFGVLLLIAKRLSN